MIARKLDLKKEKFNKFKTTIVSFAEFAMNIWSC